MQGAEVCYTFWGILSADFVPACSLIMGMICFGRCFATLVSVSATGRPCLQLSASPSSPQRRIPVWPSFFPCIWRHTSLPLKPSAKGPARNTALKRPWSAWPVNGQGWSSPSCPIVKQEPPFYPRWMRFKCCWMIILSRPRP